MDIQGESGLSELCFNILFYMDFSTEQDKTACELKRLELMNWRLGSESNRRKRCCRPLHDHSATQPHGADDSLVEFELHLLT